MGGWTYRIDGRSVKLNWTNAKTQSSFGAGGGGHGSGYACGGYLGGGSAGNQNMDGMFRRG
jgi:hypothetical protein